MILTNSINVYIVKNNIRRNVHWRFIDGKMFFELFPGLWQNEKFFDKYYPKYEFRRFNDKGFNPDKTRIL